MSIDDPPVDERNVPVTFEIIRNGSKKGGDKLGDSLGHQYNIKRHQKSSTHRQCMVRPKWYACTTMVVQRDGSFEVKGNHNHIVKVGAAVAVKIVKDVKASTIVWEVTGGTNWYLFSIRDNIYNI